MAVRGHEQPFDGDCLGDNELMTTTGAIHQLIERFCSGADISVKAANAIEVALDDAFPDDERVQDVVLCFASYRPGGGDFLYDEQEVRRQLASLLPRLSENR